MPVTPTENASENQEFDGEFDPARARTTIDALRDEVKALKANVKTLTDETTALTAAKETLETELATAQAVIAAAERESWVDAALREYPLPDGLTAEQTAAMRALLTGETQEEIAGKAQLFAALRGQTPPPAAPAGTTDDETSTEEPPAAGTTSQDDDPLAARPVLAPVPGHGATGEQTTIDHDALAQEILGKRH